MPSSARVRAFVSVRSAPLGRALMHMLESYSRKRK